MNLRFTYLLTYLLYCLINKWTASQAVTLDCYEDVLSGRQFGCFFLCESTRRCGLRVIGRSLSDEHVTRWRACTMRTLPTCSAAWKRHLVTAAAHHTHTISSSSAALSTGSSLSTCHSATSNSFCDGIARCAIVPVLTRLNRQLPITRSGQNQMMFSYQCGIVSLGKLGGGALNGKAISQLRSVTCRMRSHRVTCHPTQVNAPRLNPSQIGWYLIYLPRRDGRLSWSKRLVTYRAGLPARSQSPIAVLTRPGVE